MKQKRRMKFLNFIIVIEKEEKGKGYFAYSPTLPGCYSNGKTIEETRINMRDAIQLHLSSLLDRNQPLPPADKEVFAEELSIGLPG